MRTAASTLGAASVGRNNNGLLLRLIAASLVLYSHSFALSGHVQDEPLARAIRFMDFGTAAVIVFFVLSGFLIAQSFDRAPTLRAFVARRVFRIWPGLALATILAAFAIGPLATELPFAEYFTSRATWRYVGANLILDTGFPLPETFTRNPLRSAVNGSLWTVRLEVFLYAVLGVAGLVGLLRRRLLFTLAGSGLVAFCLARPELIHPLLPIWPAFMAPKLVACFVLGSLAYANRDHLPLSGLIACAAIGCAWLAWRTPLAEPVFYLAFVYLTLFVVYWQRLRLPMPQFIGDYSYGIYVFAFPVQQCIVAMLAGTSSGALFTLAFPVTLALAAFSWHCVERPAIDFAKRIGVRSSGPSGEDTARRARTAD